MTSSQATKTLSTQLTVLLKSLKLCKLQGVQLLASTEHLRGCHDDLALRQLNELGLTGILKLSDRADRLVHGRTSTVTRLEPGILLSESLLLILNLRLIVWLAPISVKVPRGSSSVRRLASTALVLRGTIIRRKLETTRATTR